MTLWEKVRTVALTLGLMAALACGLVIGSYLLFLFLVWGGR